MSSIRNCKVVRNYRVVKEVSVSSKSGISYEVIYIERRWRFLWWDCWTPIENVDGFRNEYGSLEEAIAEAERLEKKVPLFSVTRTFH